MFDAGGTNKCELDRTAVTETKQGVDVNHFPSCWARITHSLHMLIL